jgi:hypothetical protein
MSKQTKEYALARAYMLKHRLGKEWSHLRIVNVDELTVQFWFIQRSKDRRPFCILLTRTLSRYIIRGTGAPLEEAIRYEKRMD